MPSLLSMNYLSFCFLKLSFAFISFCTTYIEIKFIQHTIHPLKVYSSMLPLFLKDIFVESVDVLPQCWKFLTNHSSNNYFQSILCFLFSRNLPNLSTMFHIYLTVFPVFSVFVSPSTSICVIFTDLSSNSVIFCSAGSNEY